MPAFDSSTGAGNASESGAAQNEWHEDTPHLPSFYSPRTQALERPAPQSDDKTQTSQEPDVDELPSLASTPLRPHDPAFTTQPPPSLLSPAFTPPATPGTATPTTEAAPRGVPVDSSIPTGGCGSKKPRLLETLPKVQCIVRARIPTVAGTEMFLHLYTGRDRDGPHGPGAYTGRLFPGRTTSGMASGTGSTPDSASKEQGEEAPPAPTGPPLVRIHSECYTGETAWSARCDCGEQLDEAARLMSLPGNHNGGIIIYLRQEGRGIGLGEKLKAYNLQDLGSDTVEANLLLRHPADARSYGLATAMLLDLGQDEVRLLTNNPDKIRAVEGPNREVRVRERVAMVPLSWKGKGGFKSEEVEGYLKTKIEKMGHMLDSGTVPS
ncbi:GTP cyclohydrolase-2 [Verticillium alfalfae VaMs.102]|uniref:GTP cyclohydrolase II n=1 Tax=Verticillium alfalfae (strain VaMs.102 / ATCC MYA-4576 / FGSC 10136) TaxID=526221 RepID=C9S9H3_VERA1|nr:GTP cyclohydrolase-2 [Verticillium alfalfae VaMs.102]EEY16036.1 GTP cyclohydrolase-2 [Verticillium alfalfae VaMs.102]